MASEQEVQAYLQSIGINTALYPSEAQQELYKHYYREPTIYYGSETMPVHEHAKLVEALVTKGHRKNDLMNLKPSTLKTL